MQKVVNQNERKAKGKAITRSKYNFLKGTFINANVSTLVKSYWIGTMSYWIGPITQNTQRKQHDKLSCKGVRTPLPYLQCTYLQLQFSFFFFVHMSIFWVSKKYHKTSAAQKRARKKNMALPTLTKRWTEKADFFE